MATLYLTLLLSLTRPLSSEELAAAANSVNDGGTAIAEQAFASDAPEIAESLWFVPFRHREGVTAVLVVPPSPNRIADLNIDCSAWRRENMPDPDDVVTEPHPFAVGRLEAPGADSISGVTFADLDADGRVDVVAIARVKQTLRPLIGLSTPSGITQATELEARAASLGPRMTLQRIVALLRPPALSSLTVTCYRLELPTAVSDDGQWAFVAGSGGIVSLRTGTPAPWVGARLADALKRISIGCSWVPDDSAMHGGNAICADVVQSLNDVLSGMNSAPVFVPFGEKARVLDVGLGRDVVLPQPSSAESVGPGWVALPPQCRDGLPRLLLESPGGATAFLAPASVAVTPELFVLPEDAATCLCGGGTCVHDLVSVPAPRPEVTVVSIRRR